MAWFITYKWTNKIGQERGPFNKVLLTTHPVIWAAEAPTESGRHGTVIYLLFFHEIPDIVAKDPLVKKWISVED